MMSDNQGVAAQVPPGHSDEPASSLAANAGGVPNAGWIVLAEHCEAAEGPNFEFEQEIGAAIGLPNIGRGSVAPAYTASLDAAMMLVPEGWSVAVTQQDKGWAANLQQGYRTSYHKVVFSERGPNGWPVTPALALCAAALRARAAQGIVAATADETLCGSGPKD